MEALKHPVVSVERSGLCSYGGSQMWLQRKSLRKCGCGAVAMADLAVYLQRAHGFEGPAEAALDPIPVADYENLVDRLQRQYLLMIPPTGINGLSLALGIDRYFRDHGIPFRAVWSVRKKDLWQTMEQMLRQDLPVILSIGPNVPFLWQKHKMQLYRKTADGRYVAATKVNAHYVTATALNDRWIRISSWGREYYLNRTEYEQYRTAHSCNLVHNLLLLKPTN